MGDFPGYTLGDSYTKPYWQDEFYTYSPETIKRLIKNLGKEDKGMHFKNDVERKAWADYIGLRMPTYGSLEEESTAGERRAQMVKVCEEADWLIEEMRRRA
jgi:hypothetical protein